jgi:hypothetical protein
MQRKAAERSREMYMYLCLNLQPPKAEHHSAIIHVTPTDCPCGKGASCLREGRVVDRAWEKAGVLEGAERGSLRYYITYKHVQAKAGQVRRNPNPECALSGHLPSTFTWMLTLRLTA